MFRKQEDDEINRYIRERIHRVRLEANETQDDLAERLKKSRVSISDIERGRVTVSAADLALIANHYKKPISYFYPPVVIVNKDSLSPLEEELIFLFSQLPQTQQHITLEYTKQQFEITIKASSHEFDETYANYKSNKQKIPFISSINPPTNKRNPKKK